MNKNVDATAERDIVLLEHALDRFGAQCETDWLRDHGLENYTSEFLENGYFILRMSDEVSEALRRWFAPRYELPISSKSGHVDYYNAQINPVVAKQLNRLNTYYERPSDEIVDVLEGFFESVKGQVEEQLAHGWEITNVRAWSVKPNVEYGSNIWHADGFSRYMRKFLIFPNSPCAEAGSTEITTRKGEVMLIEASTPVCVLYDTNVLYHRGRSPKSIDRPMIEVTIVPALRTSTKCVFAGQLARAPWIVAQEMSASVAAIRHVAETPRRVRVPSLKKVSRALPEVAKRVRKRIKKAVGLSKTERKLPAVTNLTRCLNIGGGRRWQHRGWINLEGASGPKNLFPFWFSASSVFPVPSSTIQLVYSSHCLEHLDDATVEQALKEARRVLSADGRLVLKLPDFDEALKRWCDADERYFRETIKLHKIDGTWSSRGVCDSLDNRAAYLFCGFWNNAFGDHFKGKHNRRSRHPDSYNGPAVQTETMAKELRALDSPHEISARLRTAVVEHEQDYTFNHQNSWSRSELEALVSSCGFRVVSFDPNEIMSDYADIPGIELMEDSSMYCEAVPV